MYERGAFKREKYVTKREADEVRDNVSNVFAALREEVGEQAGLLFQKPNPSALDREVMMRVNEALDLSEELISKEVEDVRKLLM
jgi:rRNA maturation endonuclease Nob1